MEASNTSGEGQPKDVLKAAYEASAKMEEAMGDGVLPRNVLPEIAAGQAAQAEVRTVLTQADLDIARGMTADPNEAPGGQAAPASDELLLTEDMKID